MRATIVHESRGRMRLRLRQKNMTLRQADLLEYSMRAVDGVASVKVYDRTQDAVIEYCEARSAVLAALSSFSFAAAEEAGLVPEHTGRALNREFEDKLVWKTALHYACKLFLPAYVRAGIAIVRSVRYLKAGLSALLHGKLSVSVLDATAVTVSLVRRDFDTAGSVMFMLGLGELLEDWTHKKSIADLAGAMALNVDRAWVRDADGQELLVSVKDIHAGDCVVVRTGNMIPLDGRVTGGAVGGLTFILALVQTILSFFNKSPEGASGMFYCAAAIFALLMTAENSSRGTARVMQNFLFCTAKRKSGLYGIRAIESEKDAFEVGRALKMGNPDILYSGRVEFPADFIKNSEANSPADSCIKRSLIISSAVSVLLAVISGIITKDIFQAFGVLTGAFCLTSPCAIELALMIPLYLENRKLNSEGGMIAGYDAALECSEAVAASVDSADLFDRAACEMHGMKDFHTVRIDDVLLYAVAIVLKSGGPLTDVFNRIIGGSTELLPPVRDMIYEDRLGLSATIYNQRVLLGNRNLLTHHNIEVPLKSEEDKVKRNGRKILYIAIDSQVAAMFVFNYAEDASLKDSINEMADNGFSLVVRTDDPNVTDELIAARFGIAQKDVKMTLSHGARIFSAYRDSVVDSAPAKVMHDGSARSYFKSIAACGRLANFASRWAVFALIVQAVVAAGAILCVALKAFAFVSPLTAVVVQAAIVAFSVILEKFKK